MPVDAGNEATSGLVMLGAPHATDLIASTAITSCFLDAGVPLVVP